MKKNEKRFHSNLSNGQVASLYIETCYVNYSTSRWNICECFYIGAIVSNGKRSNNDWWRADKKYNKFDNVSTGKSVEGFICILYALTEFVVSQFKKSNDYSCALLINGTDNKRVSCYDRAIKHICKKLKLSLEITKDINDDGDTLYVVSL